MQARADETERLISWGFREFNNYVLFKAGETVVDAKVWLGEEETVPLVPERDAVITLARKARPGMKVTVVYDEPLPAPIQRGDKVAMLSVTAPDTAPVEFPLVAGAPVERLGFFARIGESLMHLVGG
jgi:D-alanyl-D-alanine carboxypeptidase (penicillin-binding protein 5/6)